jgi:hypothetical protein
VIRTRTVHAAHRNEKTLRSDLDLLIEQAQAGNCSLSATGPSRCERIDLVSDHTSGVFRDRATGGGERPLKQIMSRIDHSESFVSFVANLLEIDAARQITRRPRR